MLVVSRNDLVGDAESRKDVAVLSVAVRRLVQVHEIHVDLVVGKLLIRLGVQMQQGLGQDLKALDPHLCRGEGVHPGDDADTVVVIFRSADVLHTDRGSLHRGKQLDRHHTAQFFIQKIHHGAAVRRHLVKALSAVKVLTARNKIQLAHI